MNLNMTYRDLYGEGNDNDDARASLPMKIINFAKTVVSQNRRRRNNLDLSIITPRIIAMGYPAMGGGIELVRNQMSDVNHFLKQRYPRFRAYNLKRGFEYDGLLFPDGVVYYKMEDHKPPVFDYIFHFVDDVERYLTFIRDGAVAVHCKAGKGRTGVMICAYLIHTQLYSNPRQVIDFYGITRTVNNKGLTIPSQRRYVYYFAHLKRNNLEYRKHRVELVGIYFERLPKTWDSYMDSKLNITVKSGGEKVHSGSSKFSRETIQEDNAAWESDQSQVTVDYDPYDPERCGSQSTKVVSKRCFGWTAETPLPLEGDVCVKLKKNHGSRLGEIWFNTMFCCDIECGGRFHPGDREYAYPNGQSLLTRNVNNRDTTADDVVLPVSEEWTQDLRTWFAPGEGTHVETHYKEMIAEAHRAGHVEDEYNAQRSELFRRADLVNTGQVTADRPAVNDPCSPSVLQLRDGENVQIYEQCEIDYAVKHNTLPKQFRVFIVTRCVLDERSHTCYQRNKESNSCYQGETVITNKETFQSVRLGSS